MEILRHGLSIGIERTGSEFFLTMKAIGKLTHEDYEKITPMIDSALEGVADPRVNMFFDASELQGWELRAAWDDFKLGLKHGSAFDRVAIVGNKKWLEYASKLGSWFVSGEIHYFDTRAEAMAWLNG